MTCKTSAIAVSRRNASSNGPLVELPLDIGVGALEIGYRVVDRRGHLPIPSDRDSCTTRH
jgi:hypothetical protein